MFYCNALKSRYQLSINSLTKKVGEYTEMQSLVVIKFDVEVHETSAFVKGRPLTQISLSFCSLTQTFFINIKEIIIAFAYMNAIKGGIFRKFRVIFSGSLGLNITNYKSNHIHHDVSSCDLHLCAVHCLCGFPAGECSNNPKGILYYSQLRRLY